MGLLIGIFIGASAMLFVVLFAESLQPAQPSFSRPLPPRFDTLARWGAIKRVRVVTTPLPTPALPRRFPGASLVLNPVVRTWHVTARRGVKSWLTRQLTLAERRLDPFAAWNFTEWWELAFPRVVTGRHRVTSDADSEPLWNRHQTQSLPLVEKLELQRPRGRERTAKEWARIMATNARTREVRLAHRARGTRLGGKVYAGV